MSEGPVDRIEDALEEKKEDVETALALRKYFRGESDAGDLLEVGDGEVTLAGGVTIVPIFLEGWGKVLETIIELQGPAGIMTFRNGYRKVGVQDTEKLHGVFPDSALGKLFQLWFDYGYVDVLDTELVSGDDSRSIDIADIGEEYSGEEEIHVKMKDSVSVKAIRTTDLEPDYPVCSIVPSYAAGALGEWFDKEVTFEEKQCQATGADHCEFVFELK